MGPLLTAAVLVFGSLEAALAHEPSTPVPAAREADPGAAAFDVPGLDRNVLGLALHAWTCARGAGEAQTGDARAEGDRAGDPRSDDILSVIDFSLPSSEPRLWVIDLAHHVVLFRERVSHGRNSGEDLARSFSNVPGSNQTSIGLYRTAETYTGKHGRSLRLDGLDRGYNDAARSRDIVVHAADYCTLEHVQRWGRLGRSQGCPALDPSVAGAVIDTIRDGTLLFAYYPDPDWIAGSAWLGCDGAG